MNAALRELVWDRANRRCEYCRIHQDDDPFFNFHVEHIVPRQHGGDTVEDNLALSCHHCNLHKGPNLTGIDPVSRAITPLFNPRTQLWADHFVLHGVVVVAGRTAVRRATVRVMAMNDRVRQEVRIAAGRT